MRAILRCSLPLVFAALTGCAATVNSSSPSPSAGATPAAPMAASAEAARQIVMTLIPVIDVSQDTANWDALREEWQTSMSAAASAAGASFRLAAPTEAAPAGPATLVRVRVNDYRYVSQAKRYGLGVMAGNAYMDLDVEFVEAPAGRVLGTRKYATSSSAWQGVFSAMTPKQVEATSNEIVRTITGK